MTEVGSCQPGATAPVIGTGTWDRYGSGRDATTGQCPPAEFFLHDRTGQWTYYYEMTDEYSGMQSPQLLGLDPLYTPPVPFGYGALFTRVPTGFAVAQTDTWACAAWPTVSFPTTPPYSYPAAPTYRIELDGAPSPASLLQACLTVKGALPRTCLGV
ncbi:MAG: hypothetical protein JOZ04_07230 [Acidimicrobiia bacterium]|nr:hypothetical protein [Acidimicrobiia bacterium]